MRAPAGHNAGGARFSGVRKENSAHSQITATRINAPSERLIAWMRRIALTQKGRYAPVVARFSTPPRIEDLDALTLENEDFDDLGSCRPGDCGLKLSAGEIARLQQHMDRSG